MYVKKLQKHERDISENPDTTEVKDAKKWNGGSRIFGQAIRLVVGQDSASWDHTPSGNRNRPRQAHHRSNSPVKTLANSDVGGTSRDVGTTPRRRSFNRSFEKDFMGKGPRELHRPCLIHEQTTLGVPGNPEPECGEENTMQSAVVFSGMARIFMSSPTPPARVHFAVLGMLLSGIKLDYLGCQRFFLTVVCCATITASPLNFSVKETYSFVLRRRF